MSVEGNILTSNCPECLGPRHTFRNKFWCMPDCPEWGKPLPLSEVVARSQNSSTTDPSWRTDYSDKP